jgi:hypothetical protein
LKLCSWVNAQWQYGAPKRVSYNFNAIEILDRAKNNERFFCSEYATVFTQCALSIGYQARYVGLRNHVVSEAWSDEYQKWIMLDPTFCIYFAKDGIPLNCLQIHNASLGGGGIDMIVFSDAIDAKNFNQKQILKNYENFYIRMRNDWLTNRFPHWYPLSNSIMNGVQWRDKDTKPLVSVLRKTFEKDDLYWPLNQTNIAIVPSEEPFRFKVFLKTTTPNFLCFKVVVNNRQFELKDTDQIEWVMAPGENTIMASSVNVFGKEGKPSFIKVAFYE